MLHEIGMLASAIVHDSHFQGAVKSNAFTIACGIVAITVFVEMTQGHCWIQWPSMEPMANVLAAIQQAERDHAVAFDVLDPDLYEYAEDGGTRLHGMFRDDLRREGEAYGIGSRERTRCA